MGKLLTLILGLLLALPGYGLGVVLIQTDGESESPTYLVEEDFSGTTEPSGWTATNTPDYSTEGQVAIDFNDWAITPVFSAQTTLYAAFKFNTGPLVGIGSSTLFRFYDNYDTGLGYAVINVLDQFRVYHGGGNGTEQIALSTNTDYWVWISYTASSGADDGTMVLRVGTSGTYSASVEHAIESEGTLTELPAYATLRQTSYDSGGDFIFYELLISESAIGDF